LARSMLREPFEPLQRAYATNGMVRTPPCGGRTMVSAESALLQRTNGRSLRSRTILSPPPVKGRGLLLRLWRQFLAVSRRVGELDRLRGEARIAVGVRHLRCQRHKILIECGSDERRRHDPIEDRAHRWRAVSKKNDFAASDVEEPRNVHIRIAASRPGRH